MSDKPYWEPVGEQGFRKKFTPAQLRWVEEERAALRERLFGLEEPKIYGTTRPFPKDDET